MRKTNLLLCVLFINLSVATVHSFSDENIAKNMFIAGAAEREEHVDYFFNRFKQEAVNAGYLITNRVDDAAYTFFFRVLSVSQDDIQYNIHITLLRNYDNFEILSYNFIFHEPEELDQNIPFLIYLSSVIIENRHGKIDELEDEFAGSMEWRINSLYLRASFNYPVAFYRLQGDGLIAGKGVYEGTLTEPLRVMPTDNRIVTMPGITLGAEYLFTHFLSLEANGLINIGDPKDNNHINVSLGTQIKYLYELNNFILSPYIALTASLNKAPIFNSYPPVALGGGVQLGTKSGTNGIFFFDINYLFSFGDAVMKNPYAPLYTNPAEIHYRRSLFGLGIGYKHGFFNMRQRQRVSQDIIDVVDDTIIIDDIDDTVNNTDVINVIDEEEESADYAEEEFPIEEE